MRKLLLFFVMNLTLYGCSDDKSAENVLDSIRILSELGSFEAELSSLSSSGVTYLRTSYCKAYALGKEYKPSSLRKKLGREFAQEWAKNLPAVKTQCETFKVFENLKPGYRLSDDMIRKQVNSLRKMESFRLFYGRWRNS